MEEHTFQEIKVKTVTKHKDYIGSETVVINDIAIITLESEIKFDDNISPICLPKLESRVSIADFTW